MCPVPISCSNNYFLCHNSYFLQKALSHEYTNGYSPKSTKPHLKISRKYSKGFIKFYHFMQIGKHYYLERHYLGVVIIITAKFHSIKPELKFSTNSNPGCRVSEVCDVENLWQCSWIDVTFSWSLFCKNNSSSS